MKKTVEIFLNLGELPESKSQLRRAIIQNGDSLKDEKIIMFELEICKMCLHKRRGNKCTLSHDVKYGEKGGCPGFEKRSRK